METQELKIKLLDPNAKLPFYASEGAAAFDLYSIEEIILEPGKTNIVRTGLAIEIPKGYCLKFRDRSGLGAKGIHHFAGLIDSDYRGEIKVVLHNSSLVPYKIEKGDRIIQALLSPVIKANFSVVDELGATARGDGGFHSTGKK